MCVYKWILHVYTITTAAISPNSCKNINFILVIHVKKVSHRLNLLIHQQILSILFIYSPMYPFSPSPQPCFNSGLDNLSSDKLQHSLDWNLPPDSPPCQCSFHTVPVFFLRLLEILLQLSNI